MTPTATDPVQTTLDALSARLETCEAVLRSERSSGYEDDEWNGLAIVAFEVREQFADLIDCETEVFESENRVLCAIEKTSGQALSFDDTGYWHLRGPRTYCHYLLDDARLDAVLSAIAAHPVITDGQRQAVLDEYRSA